MALFVVRHQHDAERCPATDPYHGAELLNYLSRPNVREHGLEIQGEAVVQGEHTFYMIVEASDDARVHEFMKPFAAAGSVDVYAASTCAGVVASGGCAEPAPPVDSAVPAVDPSEACQIAIEAGLVVHRAHPLNCETSIPALIGGVVMPNAHFYVRNHFQIPDFDASTWRLTVGGLVERPLRLSLHDIQSMRSQTQVVTLECAGNGRSRFEPPIDGEKWNLGAVSTAEWTGVPLIEILDRAGIRQDAAEIVFRGADSGEVKTRPGRVHYERSLRVDQVRDADVILAYAMNGERLPIQHGYPLRLVVPDWYGMASVKWLTEIEVVGQPFSGAFQTDVYVYRWERDGDAAEEPVTVQKVRSLITEPQDGQEVLGEVAIRGVAWSGATPISRVEVSLDDGKWEEARLLGERKRHSWQWWELIKRLEQPGELTIRARATDLAGRSQPETAEWNRLGYGNNSLHEVRVRVI
ncbi:MAG TPA: sulfite oxidase [Dehalococcoidia bacterium]|nr:sulfite oxidase [Dehalococcoidia bacterium]